MAGLTACGFQPLHGKQTVEQPIAQIAIDTIPEEAGQALRNRLIDSLNRGGYPDNPAYRLRVKAIKRSAIGMGLDRDSESNTRVQLLATAPFELINTATQEIVTRGNARGFVAYNVLDSQFETIVARKDGEDRALNLLADDIERQIYLYFGKNQESPPQSGGS